MQFVRLKGPRDAAAVAAVAAVLLCGIVYKLSGSGGGVSQVDTKKFAQPRLEVWWQELHSSLSHEVKAANAGQGWDVVFLGDSIMEALRGTEAGGNCARCAGVPEVFNQHVASKYRAGVLGISGDQTAHLMFRITHGELPTAAPPKLAVVLIGTNDLGYVAKMGGDEAALLETADRVVERVAAIVQRLVYDLEGTRIALLGLLPRGSRASIDPYAQPSLFTAAINRVNEGFRAMARGSRRVQFVGCGGPLLVMADGSRLDESIIPDGLHPNAAGYDELFSHCWDAAFADLLG